MKAYVVTIVCVGTLLVALAAGARGPGAARAARVVVDVSAGEPERWASVITNVENIRGALGPRTEIEVVAYGKGIGLVLAKNTELVERMSKLAAAGVSFVACENTLRKQRIDRKALMPFVRTVDSGAAELVRKQQAGWAYLKPGG